MHFDGVTLGFWCLGLLQNRYQSAGFRAFRVEEFQGLAIKVGGR